MLLILCWGNIGWAQPTNTTRYDSLYAHFEQARFSDPLNDLQSLQKLERHFKKVGDSCRLAHVNSWKSNRFDELGQLDSALHYVQMGLKQFKSACDSQILLSIYANLVSIYLSLDQNDKAIATADLALSLWNPNWSNKKSRYSLFTNKAIAQVYLGETAAGLQTFKKLFLDAQIEENLADQMDASNNIAALFGMMYQADAKVAHLDSASIYVKQALNIGKTLGIREQTSLHYMNLASIAIDKKDFKQALVYLDTAQGNIQEGQYLPLTTTISRLKSAAFEGRGDLKSALAELWRHLGLKDSLMSAEKLKVVSEMQEKYESEKKERQIKELEVESLNSALREEQLTKTRNIYLDNYTLETWMPFLISPA